MRFMICTRRDDLNNADLRQVRLTSNPGYIAEFGTSESSYMSAQAEPYHVYSMQRHVQAAN